MNDSTPLYPFETERVPELTKSVLEARIKIISEMTFYEKIPLFIIKRYKPFEMLHGEKIAKKYVKYVKKNMPGCSHCGYMNACSSVFDFDHVDSSTKVDSISKMVRDGRCLGEIEEEILKTQYLCSNCHRERTALQFGWNTFQDYEFF